MTNMEERYDCEEIATALCKLSSGDEIVDADVMRDLTEALYQLQAIASNKYNADYYRTFWNMLQKIAGYYI